MASFSVNYLFSSGSCGGILPPPFKRVINGQPALHHFDWAWLLSIKVIDQHHCGASLITEEWAVTAAHCFFDQIGRTLPLQMISVVAGK